MHDKHGREIHEGDIVIGRSWVHGKDKPHLVLGCIESQSSCNINTVPVHLPTMSPGAMNAHEVVLAVKKDGEIVPLPDTSKA